MEGTVTAEAEAVSAAELSSLPACPLTLSQLGDLELLLSGALAPLAGFMTAADAAAADRKSTRLNSSHMVQSRMPSSA